MGYAILRTQKLKSGQAVRRSMTHAFREQDTPNADPERTPDNIHIGAADIDQALEQFNARLPDKVRKNAVLAVEYLITASPEDMHGKTRQEQDAYFRDALDWLKTKHGAENVVYAGIHRDEQTPHMYAYVVPIDERGKLNCRAFLGGAKALSQMQTDFSQEVGQQHGLQRGIEGSKARHTTIQQYYSRANQAFEPLPEVKTPAPKLRPEPEKPWLLAGKDIKEAYQRDHGAWAREEAAAQSQKQQRIAEVKTQRDAAVETARRHQAQAGEAGALKTEVGKLKASNGQYAKKLAALDVQASALREIAQLFTPEEIRKGLARRHQQEAERTRQAEITAQKAAESARQAEIAAEAGRRVDGLKKLSQHSAGATLTFARKAIDALRKADNDPSKVDWKAVEAVTTYDAIGQNGQTPESVIDALTHHSPGRADPASHQEIRKAVQRAVSGLEAQYQQQQENERSNPGPGQER